LNTNQAHAATD